jgi:hypothetical protein
VRKAINIFTLVFFIWLVLDAFRIFDALIYFLLVGAIPGTSATISPTVMLGIMTGISAVFVFEVLARHIKSFARIRQHLKQFAVRHSHLPKRRFNRA